MSINDIPVENFNDTKSTMKSVGRESESLNKNYYEGLPRVCGSHLHGKRLSQKPQIFMSPQLKENNVNSRIF